MPKIVSSGKCRLCGQLTGKPRMTTHLKTCIKRNTAAPAQDGKTARCFHVVVGATYDPAYWLHLEAPADVTFDRLDRVLRDIWLECCGHMSAFRFPRKRVRPTSPQGFAQMLKEFARGGFEDELEDEQQMMGERLGKRLHPGVTLDYEYDFGSTTQLSLRVLDEYSRSLPKPKIRLLARNEPPDILCAQCGKLAMQVCVECEGGIPMCDRCAAKHECGEEMLLPILNSPRTGVCGYCGPSVEPQGLPGQRGGWTRNT
jgi:hypothetical protein